MPIPSSPPVWSMTTCPWEGAAPLATRVYSVMSAVTVMEPPFWTVWPLKVMVALAPSYPAFTSKETVWVQIPDSTVQPSPAGRNEPAWFLIDRGNRLTGNGGVNQIIGSVKTAEDGKLVFDEDRFRTIMADSNIYSQPRCADCYARWNCGGGCRLFHNLFSKEYEDIRCNFVRKALKRELHAVLSANFRKSTGKDLGDYVREKIRHNEL